ncbi:MAG: efflux RND transporter permease subunit [Planctomycetaceae bacterium]
MLAKFFIDRPILAWVISIVIVLVGVVAGALLPIAEYPEIAPPVVRVSATYPGASAEVVSETVAGPIEQQVIGVENMLYMSSQSNSDGSYNLDVTFELGSDINDAQVLLQNRVATAEPQLPAEVKTLGVSVKKRSPDLLLVVNIVSEIDPQTQQPYYDQLYLSNYSTINIRDMLAKVDGVGDAMLFGQMDYSMRVWLDPGKLATRKLAAGDVISALQEQNLQVAAGKLGAPPTPAGQELELNITTLGRLTDPDQFSSIVLQTNEIGEVTYLRDVGRVELGARSLLSQSRLNAAPSAGIGVFQLPGSNALDTANRLKERMHELSQRFPEGLGYEIVYDTTPFITESISEVFKTLRDAVILVALVVLLFLQDWKSLVLPLIDVGVSLVGTFAVMMLLGFSLNNLTLFGLVLAIGIVVDDAIVVLENIERWLEKGLSVREATIGAMNEITGPILGITLVLSSVFLPSAFLGGISGQFFRQFALTIATSMIISAVNAMTMTPARASSIFAGREHGGSHPHGGKEALPWWSFALLTGGLAWLYLAGWVRQTLGIPELSLELADKAKYYGTDLLTFVVGAIPGGILGWLIIASVNRILNACFSVFNKGFDGITKYYGKLVGQTLRISLISLLIYFGMIALTGWSFTLVPSGFVPTQDRGYLLVDVALPDAASSERTLAVVEKMEKIVQHTHGVSDVISITGNSLVLGALSSNYATMIMILEPFHHRTEPELSGNAIANHLRQEFGAQVLEARVSVFGPPAVSGLGNAGGFKLMVEGTGGVSYADLQADADDLSQRAIQTPGIVGAFNGFRASTPQVFLNIDRVKARAMHVPLQRVYEALQVFLGGYYVNDFNLFGRTWQVNVQGEAEARMDRSAIVRLKVRNTDGEMVPLGSLLTIEDSVAPSQIVRYNTYPAAAINGGFDPKIGSGEALYRMEQLANQLPQRMTWEWTELSYLQQRAARVNSLSDLRNNPFSAFFLGVILVYFVLAGLYESWSLPMAVLLVVPMCLLSALVGIYLINSDINIFVQVGFVVLVGLAAKNAILIVEFARDLQETQGMAPLEAAVLASKERLRPIIMTSFAFILGVFPLVIAHGAGAEMRRPLGTAVFAGMIGVTLFGLLLTPLFYFVLRRNAPVGTRKPSDEPTHKSTPATTTGTSSDV